MTDFERHPTTGAPYVVDPNGKRTTYHRPSHFWPFDDYAGVPPIYAQRGTHIHALTDYGCLFEDIPDWFFANGETLGIPQELQLDILSKWMVFRDTFRLEAVRVELQMVNDPWRIAGTLDRYDWCHSTIVTPFGDIPKGSAIIGDTKTGSDPRKAAYAVQLPGYRDGIPYDTETDERFEWPEGPPNEHVAFIYHFPLNAAVKGEPADWALVPVDLAPGRGIGNQLAAIRGFAQTCKPSFHFQ